MTTTPCEVVDFWCKEVSREAWYRQDDALDAQIRDRFGPAVAMAQDGGFADWAETAEGSLALLILIDQFSRNIYRGSALSFAGDARARDIARAAIAAGQDREVPLPERQFVYMPFVHSEDLADQDEGIRLMEAGLGEDGDDNVLHARAHREVIRRFGRFPFRNEALGRETTPEERAFLDGGGYGAVVRELEGS
ncbi:DUF924 family protein [Rhodobacterales bacterium HKCCE2091]|nr:DUF924 family protein [Rhodobacterales bacterium HKCCE2091]